jgi:dihydrofolate reductase
MKNGFLNMIVATDNDYGIGKGNDLAWHCPEDLQIFKTKTSGSIIIMGHKTLKSLPKGKPLPNRTNVVLTRNPPLVPVEGVMYFHSIESVLKFVEGKEAWVIGGSEIYNQFIEHADEIHETDIHGQHDCDVFFDTHDLLFKTHESKNVYPNTFGHSCIAYSITIWSKK